MHYLCIVHAYLSVCGYTRHYVLVGMRLDTSMCTCRIAATLINQPSGISQAAAIAINRTQGLKDYMNKEKVK